MCLARGYSAKNDCVWGVKKGRHAAVRLSPVRRDVLGNGVRSGVWSVERYRPRREVAA